MGASWIQIRTKTNEPAKTVFDALVLDAKYRYGHDGYTGSIAEKSGFRMVLTVDDIFIYEQNENHFCNDKWADIACMKTDDGYLFFGMASD